MTELKNPPTEVEEERGPSVMGPHLVAGAHAGMAPGLAALWLAVNRSGGSVAGVPETSPERLQTLATQAIEAVADGREHMLALTRENQLVGCIFLAREDGELTSHRGVVKRLMVHPDLQRRGWGSVMLAGVGALARSVGVEQLAVSARGGIAALQRFYTERGWTLAGRWRQSLRLSERDVRDDLWFTREL